MTQEALIKLALITLLVGIGIGVLFVILIKLQRRNTVINSLVNPQNIVGLMGTVDLPFNQNSKGKVRVIHQGSTLIFTALSHFSHEFKVGEKVLIIEIQGTKVWVIPETELKHFND
ncbi:conserved hypothetical protein [Rippkaea orientalis PCC 8801]|uniref:NfeD-like C-terminal domain-containing protein n=1 Tax=Rippkaea orientalis (strain PCC 8801 / RF-1) TaxID=41431 RepID=B7JV63_RIPO1|nr:NfeD family protein [Rippkaea orientalis]ACK66915.1 conserved hypothetical protein [Rippkaea orientalis PCC 8801]